MFYRPHPRVTLDCGSELITKQSHKAECDINNILNQYKRTGILNHINKNQPLYQDLPDSYDYQESLHLIMQAQDSFASLPAKVRDHFGNDPAAFLQAFNDPSQEEYLRGVGLLKPKPQPSDQSAAQPGEA